MVTLKVNFTLSSYYHYHIYALIYKYIGNEPSYCFFVGMIKKLIDDVIGDRVLLVEEDEVSPEAMFDHEKSNLLNRFSYFHNFIF